MGAVALGVVAPWTLRNLTTFNETVPISTNSEEVLFYANCPESYSGPLIGYWSFNCQEQVRQERLAAGLPADPPGDESDGCKWSGRSPRQRRDVHRYPLARGGHCSRHPGLGCPTQRHHCAGVAVRGAPVGVVAVWPVDVSPPAIPGLVGLVLLWRRKVRVWPLVAMLVMVTATAVAVYGPPSVPDRGGDASC